MRAGPARVACSAVFVAIALGSLPPSDSSLASWLSAPCVPRAAPPQFSPSDSSFPLRLDSCLVGPPWEEQLPPAERSRFCDVSSISFPRAPMVKKSNTSGRGHLARAAKDSAALRAFAAQAAAAEADKILRKEKTERLKKAARAAQEALAAARKEDNDSEEEEEDERGDRAPGLLVVPPATSNPKNAPPAEGATGRIGGGSDPSGPMVTSGDPAGTNHLLPVGICGTGLLPPAVTPPTNDLDAARAQMIDLLLLQQEAHVRNLARTTATTPDPADEPPATSSNTIDSADLWATIRNQRATMDRLAQQQPLLAGEPPPHHRLPPPNYRFVPPPTPLPCSEEAMIPTTSEDRKLIRNAQNNIAIGNQHQRLNASDEAEFDTIIDHWEEHLVHAGANPRHLRTLLCRTRSHDINELMDTFAPTIDYYDHIDLIDFLVRSLFPDSECLEDVAYYLAKSLPLATPQLAVQRVQEGVRRYERLVKRWHRGTPPTDHDRKQWLLRKLPVMTMNAVVHVCDAWTWPEMIRHVKRVTTP
eukprot:GHVU01199139.1.p1 GENE.GHVU01199139.1~~GHVU01199139.1.p1  ORF type:complete len:530 (+),score=98.13 GHVU01199139.1:185-1774(+)